MFLKKQKVRSVSFVLAIVFALFISLTALASAATFDITQVTDNITDDRKPQISGTDVVWMSMLNLNFEILLYKKSSGTTTVLTDLPGYDYRWDGMDPQIDGNKVVWSGGPGGWFGGYIIFLYDGSGITQLSSNQFDDSPQISGDNVVWQQHLWQDPEIGIYFYNGSTTTQVADSSYDNWKPQISGNNAVWAGIPGNVPGPWACSCHIPDPLPLQSAEALTNFESVANSESFSTTATSESLISQESIVGSGSDVEVFLYDGLNTRQISDNNSSNDSVPLVSGSNVIWQGNVGSNTEVMLYDGNSIAQISDNNYSSYGSRFNGDIDGSKVVWQGNGEIFLFDGNSTTQLTNNNYNDSHPRISGDNVVWAGFDGTDTEIFFYDGNAITQVTDNNYTDAGPQISGNSIAWKGYVDGQDDEIFMATLVEEQAIDATLDFDPDTLNLKSKGKYITAYIELPAEYNVADIDVNTVLLNEIVAAENSPTAIGDHDGDGITDLMVKFPRDAVQASLGEVAGELVDVTVSGSLTDDTSFEGVDTIRVILKGKDHTDEANPASIEY